ncbi:hypothetical protein R1sor_000555 [Riccia sorocarpa]|uniref:GHMP kinase C-terminal domain-containing protein n=1 Tax=Riccia sorocarpa TaxID=122646 RepID=A0ABD3GTG5_9MARC
MSHTCVGLWEKGAMAYSSFVVDTPEVNQISMKAHVKNCSQAAALVSAILRGDARLLGSTLIAWMFLTKGFLSHIFLAFRRGSKALFIILVPVQPLNARACSSREVENETILTSTNVPSESDKIVEPKRGPLIPGMLSVKLISERHGAFGCMISGAGPTTVAITDSEEEGHRKGARIVEESLADGKLKAAAHMQKLDREGARVVESRKL